MRPQSHHNATYRSHPERHECECGKPAVAFRNGWVCQTCLAIEQWMRTPEAEAKLHPVSAWKDGEAADAYARPQFI